jgi:hypothetical protein
MQVDSNYRSDYSELANTNIEHYISLIFSTIFLSAINIAVSGHLLGYALGLSEKESDHFTIPIPYILRIKIRGSSVVAGFASLCISLLIVGLFISNVAHIIFINNLNATTSHWTACQLMATSVSVVVSLLIALVRTIIIFLKYSGPNSGEPPETPEERVKNLIN